MNVFKHRSLYLQLIFSQNQFIQNNFLSQTEPNIQKGNSLKL